MLSQGLVFALCTTLMVLTAADEKTDLIKNITDLQKEIKVVTDGIASFENQKSNELKQVKENYSSSVENANKSENQLKDFKNEFCESKLKDLTGYDYEGETTSGLKNETETYTKLVSPISKQYENYSKVLDDIKQRLQKCENAQCINNEKAEFETKKKEVDDDLSKNKDVVENEITNFRSLVSNVTKQVIETIKNKEADTESCFTELGKAKNEIDNFSVRVNNNISKAIAELNNDHAKADEIINQVNKNLTDSFSSVIQKTISKVQSHEDEATKKNVNIEACNTNALDGTLEQVKREYLQLFNASDVKTYQDEVNALINSTITTVKGYSSVCQDLESQLKACNNIECIKKNTKQVLDGKFTQISCDINENLNTVAKKTAEYKSDICTSEALIESSFSNQVESKAQFVMQCIILKVNAADIRNIQSVIFSVTSDLGDAITQLNTKAWTTKNSWQQKQQECLQDLDEYLYDIRLNVTSHENKAFSHSVSINKCLKNKTQLHDVFLTEASKEIASKIDTHYSAIEKVLEDSTNKLNDYYVNIPDLVEALRQCQQSDADCISKAKKETDEKLEEIKMSEENAKDKLDEVVVSLSKVIENDFQVIEINAKGDANDTANAVIKCIEDSIGNSAFSFAPTLLVMFITLFAHLCYYYL